MTEQTDRELLEMAAKAVGLPWERWVEEGNDSWNPLTDDGDALWLAVAINQDRKSTRPELQSRQ